MTANGVDSSSLLPSCPPTTAILAAAGSNELERRFRRPARGFCPAEVLLMGRIAAVLSTDRDRRRFTMVPAPVPGAAADPKRETLRPAEELRSKLSPLIELLLPSAAEEIVWYRSDIRRPCRVLGSSLISLPSDMVEGLLSLFGETLALARRGLFRSLLVSSILMRRDLDGMRWIGRWGRAVVAGLKASAKEDSPQLSSENEDVMLAVTRFFS
mmetsp:Transcript_40187/g.96961  ORF Transcript_40187/g.96961 Transcript_40187/m.96961 type:complete len:213 (-) Transcript_40187:289-927(-)